MIIKITAIGFNDSGKVFSVKVTRRKINGFYGIPCGGEDEAFFPNDQIQVLQMDEDEKRLPVEL